MKVTQRRESGPEVIQGNSTGIERKSSRRCATASELLSRKLSVISSRSVPGSNPVDAIASRTSSTSVGLSKSFDEILIVSVSGRSKALPFGHSRARFAQHPLRQRNDQRVSSATLMNSAGYVIRRRDESIGPVPRNRTLIGVELDDRLVMELEFAALKCTAELVLERQPPDRLRVHRRIERLTLRTSERLRAGMAMSASRSRSSESR